MIFRLSARRAFTTVALRPQGEYGAPNDYVLDENIEAFVRVAQALRAQGVI